MGLIDSIKKRAIYSRLQDELLYGYVLEEIEAGQMLKGLWGKSIANSQGDDKKVQPLYMKYRVQSIKDTFAAAQITYNDLQKSTLYEYIDSLAGEENNRSGEQVRKAAQEIREKREEQKTKDLKIDNIESEQEKEKKLQKEKFESMLFFTITIIVSVIVGIILWIQA